MPVTAFFYAKSFLSMLNKEIDFDTDTIHVALTTNTYTPNQDTHQYFSSITNEVVGTGYTAGGMALTTKTIGNTLNVVTLDAADTVWAASTITARRAVVYDRSPATDATRPLLLWIDFGADVISSAGAFTIQWDSAGIATITPADATGFP